MIPRITKVRVIYHGLNLKVNRTENAFHSNTISSDGAGLIQLVTIHGYCCHRGKNTTEELHMFRQVLCVRHQLWFRRKIHRY